VAKLGPRPMEERRHFERLFENHADRVLAFALRRVPREDAKEVVAETFLIVWRRFDRVPEEPLPWLLVVARNVIRNHDRSTRRRAALTSRLANLWTPSEVTPTEEVESRQEVLHLLLRLPAKEREALVLSVWDRLDHQTAAAVAGCSPATFAVRLHRARKRLARELSQAEYPVEEGQMESGAEEATQDGT